MMRRTLILGLAAFALQPVPLEAQWWDAQLPRRGELQIGLSGQNLTVDHRFVEGERQPLSEMFGVELDARLVPPLDSLDALLADLYPALGLPVPRASTAGVLQYDVLLERTTAPISLTFAPMDWLAVFTVIPIVKSVSSASPQLDSLVANAGLTSTAFGDNPESVFQALGNGIAQLEAIVTEDTLSADLQAEAERLLSDARGFEVGLTELSQQEYVPTESSAAGQAFAGYYGDLRSDFLAFEIGLPDIPLAAPLSAEQAVAATPWPEMGIEPLQERSTGIKFGDIELGLSGQPYNTFPERPGQPRPRFPVRVRLDGLYRFATGSPPVAGRLTDIGTGDGQADIEFRSTVDVAFGRRFWLSLHGGYNIQLTGEVERLVTSRQSPLQLGAYTTTVRWNPGNVLTLLAAPRFNFTRTITFSGLFMRTHHGQDSVEPVGPVDESAAFLPQDLEEGTSYTATSIGLAARYSTTDWSGDRRSGIPIEVELRYLHTTGASGGFAPKRNVWEVGLRFYQSIFH
jgi:hypothetical protein